MILYFKINNLIIWFKYDLNCEYTINKKLKCDTTYRTR